MQLSFRPNSSDLLYETSLRVLSNATSVTVPLMVFHGHLSYAIASSTLDAAHPAAAASEHNATADGPLGVEFGSVTVGETHSITVKLSNPNPIGEESRHPTPHSSVRACPVGEGPIPPRLKCVSEG